MRSFREFSTKLPIVLRAPNARNAALGGITVNEESSNAYSHSQENNFNGGQQIHGLMPLRHDGFSQARNVPNAVSPPTGSMSSVNRIAPIERGGSRTGEGIASRQSSRQGGPNKLQPPGQQVPQPVGTAVGAQLEYMPRLSTPLSGIANIPLSGTANTQNAEIFVGGFGNPYMTTNYQQIPTGHYNNPPPGSSGGYRGHGSPGNYAVGAIPQQLNTMVPISQLPQLQYGNVGGQAIGNIDMIHLNTNGQHIAPGLSVNSTATIAHVDGKQYVIPLVYSSAGGNSGWDERAGSIPNSMDYMGSVSGKYPSQAGVDNIVDAVAPSSPPIASRGNGPGTGGPGSSVGGAHTHHRAQVYCIDY
jgi:hypothetical protein